MNEVRDERRELDEPPGSALPDAAGFWWWQRQDSERWEMVKVIDFGESDMTAYSCEGSWGGWTLSVAPERFAGQWIKILPPNAKGES